MTRRTHRISNPAGTAGADVFLSLLAASCLLTACSMDAVAVGEVPGLQASRLDAARAPGTAAGQATADACKVASSGPGQPVKPVIVRASARYYGALLGIPGEEAFWPDADPQPGTRCES